MHISHLAFPTINLVDWYYIEVITSEPMHIYYYSEKSTAYLDFSVCFRMSF